jgi:hypothetical protein
MALGSLLVVAQGCGDDPSHGEDDHQHVHDGGHDEGHLEPIGDPSGATCPGDSTLDYETFGAPFFEMYCTRCHSSELEGLDRNGAPAGHDFDSLPGILLVADHVDQYAAAGPDSVNTMMPPATDPGPKPSMEEREDLGQWLACEHEARE